LALRLPDQVDSPPAPAPAAAGRPPAAATGPPPDYFPDENGRYAAGDRGDARAGQPGRPGRTARGRRTRPYAPAALAPGAAGHGGRPRGARAAGGRTGRCRPLSNAGSVAGEAMRGNAVLRAFSGYMVFFLAFYLRAGHFGASHNAALGGLVAAAAPGG